MHDLRHFDEKVDSRSRLDSIVDASYIGEPYFQHSEVEMIKSTAVINNGEHTLGDLIRETLDGRLNRRMKKRVESEDYRVCAAHDLAPIFEKGLSIRPKEFEKDKEFVRLVRTSGLKLKDGES
ncbi:hypothetical protein OEA41_004544 [Lepraria neglecta]|uniref:Uncharacterized protein n=1 Tax=Lepraria neglecta TaxID=209136 RepID=A0AAD9Z281_9LECA|nr:hypothetical protein OEA41_004544 [Lepraria neglecta]